MPTAASSWATSSVKDELEQAYQRFLEVADKKKEVFDEDLAAIINDEIRVGRAGLRAGVPARGLGTGTLPTASVRMRCKDESRSMAAACGDGPVDAAYEAIREAIGLTPELENYSIRAVTSGKEALGEATVRIRDERPDVHRPRRLDGHHRGQRQGLRGRDQPHGGSQSDGGAKVQCSCRRSEV